MKTTTNSVLRHAPADWAPGVTRVRDEDGNTGTFVGNSQPLGAARASDCSRTGNGRRGWLGVLVRFDVDPDTQLDVDPADLAVLDGHPFTGITPLLPTRYAPGFDHDPYPYPLGDYCVDVWYPVIYQPVGEVIAGEGKLWLVEPFPAARADGTDGCDPIEDDGGRGVAVVCRDSVPRPRGTDRDGDWIMPAKSLKSDCAYDVSVRTGKQLMAAWSEAHAIATALNNGTAERLGVHPEDIEVLLAAERGALRADSRFAGRKGEMRWTPINTMDERVDQEWVPTRQAKRLRAAPDALVQPHVATTQHPRLEGKLSTAGAPWTDTLYGLTALGRTKLQEIRGQYDGPTRCRNCGCTDSQGCPPPDQVGNSCSWIAADLCSFCAA